MVAMSEKPEEEQEQEDEERRRKLRRAKQELLSYPEKTFKQPGREKRG